MKVHPLKLWRQRKKMSGNELARRIGVSREAVRQWENDGQIPRATHMRIIHKLTGILPHQLMGIET